LSIRILDVETVYTCNITYFKLGSLRWKVKGVGFRPVFRVKASRNAAMPSSWPRDQGGRSGVSHV